MRDWRKRQNPPVQLKTVVDGLRAFGVEMPWTGQFCRYETGQSQVPTLVIEWVKNFTCGAVTANDWHETRLEYLIASGCKELMSKNCQLIAAE